MAMRRKAQEKEQLLDAGVQAFRKTVENGFLTEVPDKRGDTRQGDRLDESNERVSGKAVFIMHGRGKSVEDDNKSNDSNRSKRYGKESFNFQYSEKDKKRLNRKN